MPSAFVDLSNMPKGRPVTIPGLGTFENGSNSEISQSVFNRFSSKPGVQVVGDTIHVTTAALRGERPVAPSKEEPDEDTDVTTTEEESN